jgi:hypothetical protein
VPQTSISCFLLWLSLHAKLFLSLMFSKASLVFGAYSSAEILDVLP